MYDETEFAITGLCHIGLSVIEEKKTDRVKQIFDELTGIESVLASDDFKSMDYFIEILDRLMYNVVLYFEKNPIPRDLTLVYKSECEKLSELKNCIRNELWERYADEHFTELMDLGYSVSLPFCLVMIGDKGIEKHEEWIVLSVIKKLYELCEVAIEHDREWVIKEILESFEHLKNSAIRNKFKEIQKPLDEYLAKIEEMRI